MSATIATDDPMAIARTISDTLTVVAELMAYQAHRLNGDPQAVDLIADAFDHVVRIGATIEELAGSPVPGVVARPRLHLVVGSAS